MRATPPPGATLESCWDPQVSVSTWEAVLPSPCSIHRLTCYRINCPSACLQRSVGMHACMHHATSLLAAWWRCAVIYCAAPCCVRAESTRLGKMSSTDWSAMCRELGLEGKTVVSQRGAGARAATHGHMGMARSITPMRHKTCVVNALTCTALRMGLVTGARPKSTAMTHTGPTCRFCLLHCWRMCGRVL